MERPNKKAKTTKKEPDWLKKIDEQALKDLNSENWCNICWETIQPKDQMMLDSCQHIYCKKCLKIWNLRYNKNKCPLCRKIFTQMTYYDDKGFMRVEHVEKVPLKTNTFTMENVERLSKIISESDGTFLDTLACIEHEFDMRSPVGLTKLALRRQLIHYESDVVVLNEDLLNKYMTPFNFYEYYTYSPDCRVNIIIHFGFNNSYRKFLQDVLQDDGTKYDDMTRKVANMMFDVIRRFLRVNDIDINKPTLLTQWFHVVDKVIHTAKKRFPHTPIQNMSVYNTKHRHVIRTIGLLKGWDEEKMTDAVMNRIQKENETRDEYIKRLPKF